MSSDETIEEIRERAAAYALGALSAEEARVVEARLAAGDARYVEEVAACRGVVDDLAYAARPQAPSPAVRARVLAAVSDADAPVVEVQGLRFVRGRRVEWQPGMVDGLELKLLRVDADGSRATVLARMAPGVVYPSHRHAGVEEIFLVEGDLAVNGVSMRAGDYCSADAGTVHDGVRTTGGCTFIVTASLHDELLA